MPKAMRPVVKIEDGAGGGHAEEGRQEEADAGGERQRRRLNDAGDAVSAEAGLMMRANAELQAQAIEGMERTRVQGEELQRAKVRIAELAAEVPALRWELIGHLQSNKAAQAAGELKCASPLRL
jgi:hypothetical protein